VLALHELSCLAQTTSRCNILSSVTSSVLNTNRLAPNVSLPSRGLVSYLPSITHKLQRIKEYSKE
jgi:hypothetical protein